MLRNRGSFRKIGNKKWTVLSGIPGRWVLTWWVITAEKVAGVVVRGAGETDT